MKKVKQIVKQAPRQEFKNGGNVDIKKSGSGWIRTADLWVVKPKPAHTNLY